MDDEGKRNALHQRNQLTPWRRVVVALQAIGYDVEAPFATDDDYIYWYGLVTRPVREYLLAQVTYAAPSATPPYAPAHSTGVVVTCLSRSPIDVIHSAVRCTSASAQGSAASESNPRASVEHRDQRVLFSLRSVF